MRRPEPSVFPTLMCAAILTAGAAGVAAGAHLQKLVPASKPASKASFSFFANAQAQSAYRFVDDQPKLAPVPPPDVAAPKFSRIIIEKSGVSRLEGDGTPGSQVLIKSSGVMIGAAVVGADGRWAVALENKLDAGDHAIASVAAGRETTQAGDEVRVFIPADFAGQEIVAYDRARNEREALLPSPVPTIDQDAATAARAEELANAATEKFSEIVPPKASVKETESKPSASPAAPPRAGIDIATPVAGWLERASQAYKDQVADKLAVPADQSAPVETAQNADQPASAPQPEAAPAPSADPLSAGVDAVRSWLKDASETYDRDIATPLSVPANPNATAETVIKEAKPPVDTKGDASEAAHKVQMERERAAKALRDAEARDAARAAAEEQRQAGEAKRRKADENAARARDAARGAAEQARKEAEAKKIQDGLKRLEDAQRAEEQRKQAADAKQKKPAPAAGPLPSETELSRDRSFAETQAAPSGKRLEFTVDGEDEDKQARDQDDSAEPDRTAGLREEQANEQDGSRSMKRAGSKQKPTRVGGWRSRDDDDARYARSCSAGTLRRGGRKHMIYIVQPGDTLWAIANRHYRHGSRYNIIYRANQDRLPSADLIRPCQRLVLPLRGKRRV